MVIMAVMVSHPDIMVIVELSKAASSACGGGTGCWLRVVSG